MKQLLFFFSFALLVSTASAQSERYEKAMLTNIGALDTTRGAGGYQDLANTFQRIGDAEKTQWLPYYYAAYCHVMIGYAAMGQDPAKMDVEADLADGLLNKAMALTQPNSELFCIKKMISTLRMSADPMNRYQTQGPIAAEAMAKARAMDANNPRVDILEAQDKFFTPEQFGGSKAEAKELFLSAQKKFETFKPASALHPNWGRGQVIYFLSQLK